MNAGQSYFALPQASSLDGLTHACDEICSETLLEVQWYILKLCTASFAPNTFLLLPTLLAHPLSILSHILSIFFLLLLSCVKYRNLYCFLQFGPLSQITRSPTARITKECTYAAAMLDFIEKARHVHTSVSLKSAARK